MTPDFNRIKAFAFDVDGVMTDGGVFAFENDLFRCYDAKDSFALRLAATKGYKLAIVTSGRSDTIRQRFSTCGFKQDDIYLHCIDKVQTIECFCTKYGLDISEVAYCGDDLPDISAMQSCGIGACPADAVDEVKEVADYVGSAKGGHGFVRQFVEAVLKLHGNWSFDMDSYKLNF